MADFTKQGEQPLYPEVFWNRPTMKRRAGRLLIIGGHKHEFSLIQAIYQLAESAGIGECMAVMPDTIRKLIGEADFARFVPASQSGSLGKAATADILELAQDSDAVIIGANLTNNAETGVLIESLLSKLETPVVITEEAIEILKFKPDLITANPNVLVITTMPGLFALANHHKLPITIRPGGGVVGKIAILRQVMDISQCAYLIFDQEIMAGVGEEVTLTDLPQPLSQLPGAVIGVASTFWVQNLPKPLTGLTGAAYLLAQDKHENPSYRTLTESIRKFLFELE